MAETGYINYGSTQSNVPAELKVYYNVVTRTAESVTIDIDVGVHYTGSWSSNGCWVQVSGEQRCCNPNHVEGQRYWYASSQGNSRSSYWKRVTLSAAAANTSVSLGVGFSNKAYAAGTYQYNNFTLTIPVGNTNACWVNPACNVSPSDIFSENTDSLSVSWSGAKDDQGDQILYKVEIWKNGSFTGSYVGGSGTTSTSGTVNIAEDSPGTSYYFRTYCKDATSGSWVFGKQSSTVMKNKLTAPSSFNITSPSRITPGPTYVVTCTHSAPSNSNGNTTFTYGLTAQYVTSTGYPISLPVSGVTSARVAPATFTITIWDGTGTTPTGIYIKQSDIQSKCDSSYFGMLRLNLTCSNAYGSSETVLTSKVLNWRYTPSAPSAPTYSASSYFTLPDMSEPVFIINQREITWTWGAVTDPNGGEVSYEVYSKSGDNAWKKVATTTSRTYTTPKKGLLQSEIYQIKVIARFEYDTFSPESVGPEITLHYYHTPRLTASVIDREQNSVTVKASVSSSTSIPNPIGSVSLTYAGLAGTATTSTTAPPYRSTFEEQKQFSGLTEPSAGKIELIYKDSVMSAILGTSASVSASVEVTQWAPLLTIREKGVGINAIAGDFADLIAKGTVSIYGGDASGQADGSINFATNFSAPINLYIGAYLDSAGELRAAQDLSYKKGIIQIQFCHTDTTSVPVRWRLLSSNRAVAKDEVIVVTSTSSWCELLDTEMDGVDGTTIASKINSYVVRQNVARGGICSVRDAGAIQPTTSTGYLLFPFTKTYDNDDYFTIEATFGWHTDVADVPTKMYAYTGCLNDSYMTKCFILGNQIVNFGQCAVVQQASTGIYYFQLNSNAYSFVGNAFINTDLIHARGTYLPTSAASGVYAPILATSLSGYNTISTGNITYK